MQLDNLIKWLNVNQGATNIIAVVIAAMLAGLGWVISGILKKPAANFKSIDDSSTAETVTTTLSKVMAKKEICLGVLEYPPLMSYKIKNDGSIEAFGIFPRLLSKIVSNSDIRIIWKALDWSSLMTALNEEEVDAICSIFLTPRRSEIASFCGLIHRIGVSGIVRFSENRIVTQKDLLNEEIKIVVVKGEIGWEYSRDVLNLGIGNKRLRILDQSDISSASKLVESGLADILLADSLSCRISCDD
ncbi:MAG: transporter substrate-binding domain-containing protein, partial [Caulobacterales bacterium]|nr:transporter substrate-binding domain-containing protein [Caulobacterales bacterium]